MQLVLVDTWAVKCSLFLSTSTSTPQLHAGYLRFDANDLRTKNLYNDSNDKLKLVIASKPKTDTKSTWISVTLPLNDLDEKWSVVSGNVFRNLSKEFPDNGKIEVSVYLKCSLYDQMLEIATLKGKSIDSNNYICAGSFKSSTFEGLSKKEIKKIHLKVVVDIPEKSEIVTKTKTKKTPLQEDDFPASKMILAEGLFSDVTISAGNGVEIKAHKCFLSAHSPVLKKRFENDMKESKAGKVERIDASDHGVRAFLRYLYYGDLKEPKDDIEIAFELLSAAHKYEVCSLETEMVKCLLERTNENFTVKLAFKMYLFVRNVESAVELKKKTIEIMKAELDELESLQEYKDLFEKPSNSRIAMELLRDVAKASSNQV